MVTYTYLTTRDMDNFKYDKNHSSYMCAEKFLEQLNDC
jgi:hypothetical protein